MKGSLDGGQPVEAWGGGGGVGLSKTKDYIQDYEVPVMHNIFSYHLLKHWLLCFLLEPV